MGVKKYTQEVVKEGKRVRWPKKEVFFPCLLTVLIICVFCALVLSLEDWVGGRLISQLKDLFSGIKGNSDSSATSEASGDIPAAIQIFRNLF